MNTKQKTTIDEVLSIAAKYLKDVQDSTEEEKDTFEDSMDCDEYQSLNNEEKMVSNVNHDKNNNNNNNDNDNNNNNDDDNNNNNNKKSKNEKTEKESPSKIKKVNIKASDKENSEREFDPTTIEQVSRKISNGKNCLKKINPPPQGSNFFYESHKSFNGCHSAAWQIEQSPNSLLKATVLAFAYHLPLRLKPDHILYSILSGFNIWLNEMGGYKKISKNHLIDSSKKNIKIEIPPNPDWDKVVKNLGERLEDAITNKDLLRIMKTSFTTTTQVTKQMKILTIASIMKNFATIEFTTLCGIPYVTLEGTPQDWESIKVISTAILSISDGDLNWWIKDLNSSLDKMIETSKGRGSQDDWKNFLNYKSTSGSHTCSGWINSFFPFVKSGKKEEFEKNDIVVNGLVPNNWSSNAVDFSKFPSSVSKEVYMWTNSGKPYKTLYVTAGLVDVVQWIGEDYALEPFIGYQIDSKDSK